MTLLFISLVLVVLLLLGTPIAVTMGITGMVYFLLTAGFDYFPMIVTRIFKGMDSFVFICVPLYIMAGDLMNATGLTGRPRGKLLSARPQHPTTVRDRPIIRIPSIRSLPGRLIPPGGREPGAGSRLLDQPHRRRNPERQWCHH